MVSYAYRRVYVREKRENEHATVKKLFGTDVELRQFFRLEIYDSIAAKNPWFISERATTQEDLNIDRVLDYLNQLGLEGWRLVGYYPDSQRLGNGSGRTFSDWPYGTHMLLREVVGP